jgi:hypothetical protein
MDKDEAAAGLGAHGLLVAEACLDDAIRHVREVEGRLEQLHDAALYGFQDDHEYRRTVFEHKVAWRALCEAQAAVQLILDEAAPQVSTAA